MKKVIANLMLLLILTSYQANGQIDWLEKAKFKDRIEGIIARPAGRPLIELISIMNPGKICDSDSIFIHFYCPDAARLSIEVKEIRFYRGYLLKVEREHWNKGWNVFVWPTNKYAKKIGVNFSNLGALIKYIDNNDNNRKYLPAFISDSPIRDTIKDTAFSIFLMPGDTFSEVSYTYFKGDTTLQAGRLVEQYDGMPFILPSFTKKSRHCWMRLQINLRNNKMKVVQEYDYYQP